MKLHVPVMLESVLKEIDSEKPGICLDATIGYAGHASEILKKNPKLKLIGFDQDSFAVEYSRKLLGSNPNVTLIKSNFRDLTTQLKILKISEIDYFLFDLGISSVHVDKAQRGFSYNKDGPLDMRMDQEQTYQAYNLINEASYAELGRIFSEYADVKLPKVIAKAIIENRPISSTLELVELIKRTYPSALLRAKNQAKPIFQALRIAVNDEFNALSEALNSAVNFMKKGSKLLVITFHSGEDRIVKNFFGNLIKTKFDPKLPIMETKKFIARSYKATEQEINNNKRARSAKLRVLEKLID